MRIPKIDIANQLLGDLDDPTSNYSMLIEQGNYQAVLGFTYSKVSLINVAPEVVRHGTSCHAVNSAREACISLVFG